MQCVDKSYQSIQDQVHNLWGLGSNENGGPHPKIIKNSKMMRAEHETKQGSFWVRDPVWHHRSLGHDAGPGSNCRHISNLTTHILENWIKVKVSCTVMSVSLWPHGLLPARLLCPWNFPGKNTGVGCHFFSRESSPPRDWTWVSCIAGRFFTNWVTRKSQKI